MATASNQPKKSRAWIPVAVVFVLVCLVAGLIAMMKLVGSSAGGTLRSGRSIMVHSNSLSLSTALSKDTATIDTAGKTIVVMPTQLLIDGAVVAEIDEAVKNVTINVEDGDVSFVADDTAVPLNGP